MPKKALVLHTDDNVAVALENGTAGDRYFFSGEAAGEVAIEEDIVFGHKIALTDIVVSERIIKYGHPIGIALQDIGRGKHVHVHNVRGLRVETKEDQHE